MKKHIFVVPKNKPMPNGAPNWIGYTCKHCGELSGLDRWQLVDMPSDMAQCKKSPVRMGIIEKWSQSVNCMEN